MATSQILELLTPTALAIWLPVLLTVYFTVGAITNYRKLSQFKGPPLAGLSRFWMFWHTSHAALYQAEKDALKKYGSPARIAPNLLVVDDPEVVRHLNAPTSRWTRSTWYEAMKMDPREDTVFSTRDDKLHADLKAKQYSGREIDGLESDIDIRIVDLINLIKDKHNGTSVDLSNLARYFTLDVLSTVAFGRPFGFMEKNEDLWAYNKANAAFMQILELTNNHPTIYRILASDFMQSLAAPKITDKEGVGPAMAFAREAVAERYTDNPKVRNDMLNHFKKKGFTQLQAEANSMLQIAAGSDSTTTVLRCTLFCLIANPAAYMRLRTEVDDAIAAGRISSPVIKYAEATKLPYLNACLMEGIRMYPPLFGLKTKQAPPGGDTINGVYYPEGTEVGLCDDAMCRRKDIFGADSDVFRPDRWIEANQETNAKMTRTVDYIFGSGKYVCLGKTIAWMEMKKVTFELMRHYDWALADPMKGIYQRSHSVHVQYDMNVIPRPRAST